MAKKVTIDLKDLRLLVKMLRAYSIESQAQRLLRKKQPKAKQVVVTQYLMAVKDLVPRAKTMQDVRFADLLSSLKSGSDVPLALTNFLNREAKSANGTGTKPRPPQ